MYRREHVYCRASQHIIQTRNRHTQKTGSSGSIKSPFPGPQGYAKKIVKVFGTKKGLMLAHY